MSEAAEFRPFALLVVRGDLRSHYGYGKALRAHVKMLAPYFKKIVGVDLHFHPNRAHEAFPWEIVSDVDADALIDQAVGKAVLLNYSTPNDFRRHPKAHNLGLFYWETDRFTPGLNWSGLVQLMDEMWVPTEYMRGVLRSEGFEGKIECVPWPQTERTPSKLPTQKPEGQGKALTSGGVGAKPAGLPCPDLGLYRPFESNARSRKVLRFLVLAERILWRILRLSRVSKRMQPHRWFGVREIKRRYLTDLDAVIARHKTVHLAIAQNTPRKGLPLLIEGWLDYMIQHPDSDSALILKLGTLNVDMDAYDLYFEVAEVLYGMTEARGIKESRIYLALDYYNEAQMDGLYRSCTGALLSTTLGEGFGGPVAEAAMRGMLVICPNHTALADLLPKDYPLAVEYDMRHLSIRYFLSVYSLSSKWGLVRPGALARALRKFEQMTESSRTAEIKRLRAHVLSLCGWDSVSRVVQELMFDMSLRLEGAGGDQKKNNSMQSVVNQGRGLERVDFTSMETASGEVQC